MSLTQHSLGTFSDSSVLDTSTLDQATKALNAPIPVAAYLKPFLAALIVFTVLSNSQTLGQDVSSMLNTLVVSAYCRDAACNQLASLRHH